jgi:Na+/H+ antiporter NhaD/arsenite permease-like protein
MTANELICLGFVFLIALLLFSSRRLPSRRQVIVLESEPSDEGAGLALVLVLLVLVLLGLALLDPPVGSALMQGGM